MCCTMSSISITTAPPIFPFDVADRSGKTGHIAYVTEIHVDLSYYMYCRYMHASARDRKIQKHRKRQTGNHTETETDRERERVFESKRVCLCMWIVDVCVCVYACACLFVYVDNYVCGRLCMCV